MTTQTLADLLICRKWVSAHYLLHCVAFFSFYINSCLEKNPILVFETCDITLQTSLVHKAETFSVSLHISDSYNSFTLFCRQLSDALCFGNTPVFNIISEVFYPEKVSCFLLKHPLYLKCLQRRYLKRLYSFPLINMCSDSFPLVPL